MVNACCVKECKNQASPGLSLHSFPNDVTLRNNWIQFVNKPSSWVPKQWSRICSEHFSKACFENIPGVKKLRLNATPTLSNKNKMINEPLVIKNNSAEKQEPFPVGQKILFEKCYPELGHATLKSTEPISLESFLQIDHSITTNIVTELNNKENQTEDKDDVIKKLQMELKQERNSNKLLRDKVKEIRQQSSRIGKKKDETIVRLSKESIYNTVFNQDQIDLIHRRVDKKNINGIRWSNKTIEKSLKYRFTCGGTGYEEIRKTIPLPSQRTLARKIENLKFDHGILHEMLELLKYKVTDMTFQDRDCIIMTDEMSIEEGVDYDASLKRLFGHVTFPKITPRKAKNGLVIMLAGIQSGWKVIVGYELTSNVNNTEYGVELKKMITEIIEIAENMGLRVHLNVNDMGPLNIKMWKSFGVHCKKVIGMEDLTIDLNASIEHPFDHEKSTRSLHFMADVPHLFKNICQALINNRTFTVTEDIKLKYKLKSNVIDFTPFEDLFDVQEGFNSSLRLAPKLEAYKLKPSNFEKMKVKTSYHVLHKDVSAALKLLAEEEEEDCDKKETYLSTAWFIDFVVKWFYLMTSRSQTNGALDPKNTETYSEAITFLKECIEVTIIFTFLLS